MIALTLLGVIVLYLTVTLSTTWFAYKAFQSRRSKWLAVVATILVSILIPFGDAIVGYLYFQSLCRSEAGMKINKVVSVDPKYFDRRGYPLSEYNKGKETVAEHYEVAVSGFGPETNALHIGKMVTTIRDTESGDVLGERVNFFYFGGWVAQFAPHVSGISCPNNPALEGPDLIQRVLQEDLKGK